MTGLVELARYQTRVEADFARLRLKSDGIESVLFDEEAHAIGWGPMMPVRLMVLDRDRWRAQAALRADQP